MVAKLLAVGISITLLRLPIPRGAVAASAGPCESAGRINKYFQDVSGEWRDPSPSQQTESGIMEREMLCLHIIDAVSRRNVQWFAGAKDLVIKLRQLWNNADFKGRYVVHAPCNKDLLELTIKPMTEHKYKVPRLLVNCFIRHYRHNSNDLDLLCDILFVFIGRYVTDFCFVREFLEREVIPVSTRSIFV
ncbi:hypothetical protein OSTOST_13587 [Ostertagia ostertagi]